MRYKYQSTLKDGNGKVIDGATISIYLAGTTTPADVYTASSGGTAVNSVTTDNGVFEFWIDTSDHGVGQAFKIVSSKAGFVSTTWDNLFFNRPLGSAALVDTGTASDEVPLNSDLGSASTKDVGLLATNVLQSDQTEASTATATTTALGTATTKHLLTGTTTITGFTGTSGVTYHCRAEGAFTLTHHATNLIITQTGASITTAAGDTFGVQMITGTTCRIVNYTRADGRSISLGTSAAKDTGTASANIPLVSNIPAVLLAYTGAAANMKAFIDAAGTAVEWASGVKIITATRDMTAASGNVAYTGIGFKPSLIIAKSHVASTVMGCDGMTDGTEDVGMRITALFTEWNTAASFIDLIETGGVFQAAAFSSFDSDGFTLTWTKSGSPSAGTANLYFICFR